MNAEPKPIRVQILFFGATADAVGARELEMDFPEKTTSDEAFRQILAEHPQLAGHQLLFAVNQEYANDAKTINNGDELAVFTAVSGG